MLQSIRDRLVGWVAWGVVILISVPFAIIGVTDFGFHSYSGGHGYSPDIAKVNGTGIDRQDYQQRLQARRQAMQRQLGSDYQPNLDRLLEERLINEMIEARLLLDLSEKNNLQVSDQELSSVIQNNPEFQQDEQFDFDHYRSQVGRLGFSTTRYEDFLRNERIRTTVPRAVLDSTFMTADELKRYQRLILHRRQIAYLEIAADHFAQESQSVSELTEDELRQFYEDNPKYFMRPEQAKLEYIQITSEQFIDQVAITDDTLRQRYQQIIEESQDTQQRQASHILLNLAQGKSLEDSPEVTKTLSVIQAKLAAGEDFAELAQNYSQDVGSAQNGGSLGAVTPGTMVAPFEKALFAMTEVGSVSEPVITSFGVHLIKLDKITQQAVEPFEEMKEQLKVDLAKQQAANLFYDAAERLAELSYENPGTLLPAAQALGIDIQSTDWIDRDQNHLGVIGNEAVLRAAFSEKLANGDNSDPIEIGDSEVVVVRVVEYREAAMQDFVRVKEQIVNRFNEQMNAQRVSDLAKSLVQAIRSGQSIEQVGQTNQLLVKKPDALARNGTTVPVEISQAVFKMRPPQSGQVEVTQVALDNSNQAVVVLLAVQGPDQDINATQFLSELNQRYAQTDIVNFLSELKAQAQITMMDDEETADSRYSR